MPKLEEMIKTKEKKLSISKVSVTNLEAVVRSKDTDIQAYKQVIENKDKDIARLTKDLQTKDEYINSLNTAMQHKDGELSRLKQGGKPGNVGSEHVQVMIFLYLNWFQRYFILCNYQDLH